MKRRITLLAMAVISVALLNCCKRVMVPPLVDLKPYEVIGIVRFKSEAEGNLADYVTQRFIRAANTDQMIQVVELGKEPDVLSAVGKTMLDPDAIKAIGAKYDLRTIITGELTVSDVHPRISIGPGFSSVSASADVDASLSVRLVQTSNAATVWSGMAREKREVGNVNFFGGHFSFDAKDPESAYGGLVDALVRRTTRDFRVTYQRR